MNYREACSYILNIPKFTSKNQPGNMKRLLEALGQPQNRFPVIHVAGTNGKGSVCAFLASILKEDHKRVGLFTSPHLVEVRERFQIQGQPVSEEVFLEGFLAVRQAVEHLMSEAPGQQEEFFHPTFFEWLFAMSTVIFAREGVEFAVMETGLGGRLDATNVVEHPYLTVITSISLDHTEILGDTIEKIAREKAGIIKDNVPLVYDGREERAARVIEEEAEKHKTLCRALKNGMYEIFMNNHKNIDFSLDTGYYLYNDITVSSPAEYQAANASLAVMAAEVLYREYGIGTGTPDREMLLRGIRKTRWPGRMEEVLPDVFLDGGHNAAGIAEFTNTVEKFQDNRDITLLFSAVKEKDYEHMVKTLCDRIHFQTAVVTQVQGPRAVKAETLCEEFHKYTDRNVVCCPDIRKAFLQARQYQEDGMLFCVGSLYLVGELKELLKEEEQ